MSIFVHVLLRDACPLCLLLVHEQQHGPFLFAIFCHLCGMMLSGVYAGVMHFFAIYSFCRDLKDDMKCMLHMFFPKHELPWKLNQLGQQYCAFQLVEFKQRHRDNQTTNTFSKVVRRCYSKMENLPNTIWTCMLKPSRFLWWPHSRPWLIRCYGFFFRLLRLEIHGITLPLFGRLSLCSWVCPEWGRF